jgi:ATP-dependent Clp protease ATP-binding subunit ClpA
MKMPQSSSNPPRINHYVRRALGIANNEALGFRHLRIHPEHILLGLIQAEGSITETVLSAMNVTAQITRKVMTETISKFEKVSNEELARNELANWSINLEAVLKVIGDVTPKIGKVAPMHYTPELSSTSLTLMSQAIEMVWQQRASYFCTEHMLLALLALPDSGTQAILEGLGLSQAKIQQTLERLRDNTQEFQRIKDEGPP